MKYISNTIFTKILAVAFFAMLTNACKKDLKGVDTYPPNASALGIKMLSTSASPTSGRPGTAVTIAVTGLKKYEGQYTITINGTPVSVLTQSDSMLTFKVPDNASSGIIAIAVQNQVLFGPKFTIDGNIRIDRSFKVVHGSNGPISDAYHFADGRYILTGAFTDYEKKATSIKPIGGIAEINADGTVAVLNDAPNGVGTTGSINAIVATDVDPNQTKLLIGGAFSTYNETKNVNSLARIALFGALDTAVTVEVISPDPTKRAYDTGVSKINAGVWGAIDKMFIQPATKKLVVVGDFGSFVSTFYERSTAFNYYMDATQMNGLARIDLTDRGGNLLDCTLDSSYYFDKILGKSYRGVNGGVSSSLMNADGSIILVGEFSKIDNGGADLPVRNIVKIKADGTVDVAFASTVYTDGGIYSITQTPSGGYVLTGKFKNVNGVATNGIALLNADGTVNTNFKSDGVGGGYATYAQQLSSAAHDLIIVTGTFQEYKGIVRQGFMVLDKNGALASGYNNTGAFIGSVRKMIETKSGLGNTAVMMIGNISQFDNTPANNIIRFEVLN